MDQTVCLENLPDYIENIIIDFLVLPIAHQANIRDSFLEEFLDSTVTAEIEIVGVSDS